MTDHKIAALFALSRAAVAAQEAGAMAPHEAWKIAFAAAEAAAKAEPEIPVFSECWGGDGGTPIVHPERQAALKEMSDEAYCLVQTAYSWDMAGWAEECEPPILMTGREAKKIFLR